MSMDIVKIVLKDCIFPFNDVLSCHEGKSDIEVSFSNLIVTIRHTFMYDTVKIHVKVSGHRNRQHAEHLAKLIAKMSCVLDSPRVDIDACNSAKCIDFMIKSNKYDFAKLLILFTRYPISEDHEENIL
jgi:hypothetical protein